MELSLVDRWLCGAEVALRTLSGGSRAERPAPSPAAGAESSDAPPVLNADEKRLSGALMRVNHVGEVCAQALYQAQALATSDPDLKKQMARAAREEIDHLAWTEERLAQLGDRPSLLNPLWYGGAFLIGLVAGRLGDRVSLGFVVETERQVEHHLESHLDRLPAGDLASRAIVDQMRIDEAEHAVAARLAGGIELPALVRGAMRLAARVMTGTAHYL
ncbi:MAG: 2-polyprenyl-3-methyl-6-methoxy-1,4-benzoquinone monooxygenase [Burkholderiaceae bacterium]